MDSESPPYNSRRARIHLGGDNKQAREDMLNILSDDEIKRLTDRTKRPAQIKVLLALGYDYQRRPDGSLVVYADRQQQKAPKKKSAPDFSAAR